jgi:GT2 family glycosyltransferase
MREEGSMVDVSVCIPFAEDFPHIYFTVNNIVSTLVHSGLTHEVLVVVNNTKPETLESARKSILDPATDFSKFHKCRVLSTPDRSTVPYDVPQTPMGDIPSNGLAANVAAAAAEGRFLLMCDSHVIVHPNLFTECIKVMEEHEDAGLVHAPVTWTGIPYAKNPDGTFRFANNKRCYQYRYREFDETKDWYLSRHFHGTYNHHLTSEKPYPIAGCGHGLYMVRKSTWDRLGGYHPAQLAYGGREAFMTFKSWLLGYRNFTVPMTNHIHYNGRRLYTWNMDLWMRNNMQQAYCIGGEKWLNIIYENFKKKPGVKAPIIERLRNEAEERSVDQRRFVLDNQKCEFEDLFKLWDSTNVFY